MLLLTSLKNSRYTTYGGIYTVFKFLLMVIFFYYLKSNGKVLIHDRVPHKSKAVEIRTETGAGLLKRARTTAVRADRLQSVVLNKWSFYGTWV